MTDETGTVSVVFLFFFDMLRVVLIVISEISTNISLLVANVVCIGKSYYATCITYKCMHCCVNDSSFLAARLTFAQLIVYYGRMLVTQYIVRLHSYRSQEAVSRATRQSFLTVLERIHWFMLVWSNLEQLSVEHLFG